MNEYIRKYQKVVCILIKKSFHELKTAKIKIIEVPEFFPFWSFAQKDFSGFIIFINKSQRRLDSKAMKGNLAHELCHIVLFHKDKTLFGDLFFNFIKFLSFVFNTDFSRRIEIKVDKEVIRRGYAKNLLASHKSWEDSLSKKDIENLHSRGYLSPKQIKSYARHIRK